MDICLLQLFEISQPFFSFLTYFCFSSVLLIFFRRIYSGTKKKNCSRKWNDFITKTVSRSHFFSLNYSLLYSSNLSWLFHRSMSFLLSWFHLYLYIAISPIFRKYLFHFCHLLSLPCSSCSFILLYLFSLFFFLSIFF